MRLKDREANGRTYRPLNKHEIDRRIDALIADLAQASVESREQREPDEALPRSISAGELVRRMRPFLGLN